MHEPVLYQEIIHALQPHDEGFYVDGTLGAGGHARGLLEASAPGGKLLGLDVDPQAIAIAHENLASFSERLIIIQASYTTLKSQLKALDWQSVDGILLDLGVSSMQFDTPGRGFSFRRDEPLDMRFNPAGQGSQTAASLVNNLPESELADLLYQFGEERRSRQVARAIVQARPIETTGQLAKVVAKVTRGGSKLHPATRTFQALRISVNQELQALQNVLPQALEALTAGGRLAVISFHSLEDRIVKNFFRQESQDCICPEEQPVCICGHQATIRRVTRKPIRPAPEETRKNPRARSSKLRVAEKI